LDISNNGLYAAGTQAIAEGLEGNQVLIELNISGNGMRKISLYEYGHPDMAISGVAALADVIPGMGTLTHLDLGSNNLAGRQQAVLKTDCTGNSFNVGDTAQHSGANWHIIGICGNPDYIEIANVDGLIALVGAIKDMRALTSLNLSSNILKAKGAKILVKAIKVTVRCAIAIVLAQFSCPSDHWLNCCCLLLSTGYGGVVGAGCPRQHHPTRREGATAGRMRCKGGLSACIEGGGGARRGWRTEGASSPLNSLGSNWLRSAAPRLLRRT
jgi:hypothetical protein